MPRLQRSARVLAVALTVGLSLTACGDKDQKDSGADHHTKPPTAKMTQDDFGERMFRAMMKSGSARVHFEAGSRVHKTIGDGEVKYGKKMAMRMAMTPPTGATATSHDVIVIGDTVYVPIEDKYMSMSMDSMKGQGLPDMSSALDPHVQAKAFDSAVTAFKQAGPSESIDGVKATPYAITIDPKKAPDVFGATFTEPLSFVFFVGPDDLPRKMVYKDPNGEFVAKYSHWGRPVNIEAPPADKIMKGMG
ncbi:MAG TPA: hypothetical protein VM093_10080 [Aeromicrobium sp.]|nr:hypothetical protein [Aeromicrobium sp.]